MSDKTTLEASSMLIAGRPTADPGAVVERYLDERAATVTKYDWAAARDDTITKRLLDATRGPWQMNSRISFEEGEWLLERSKTAPWAKVPPDARLVDADPLHIDGIYDAAESLWDHFWLDRPRGIALTKLSVILHLTRPALIPLVNPEVLRLYEPISQELVARLSRSRADFAGRKVMTWAAMRDDLVAGESGFRALREGMLRSSKLLVCEAAGRLSDLRLLDILAKAMI